MPHSEPITAAYEALHSGCGLINLEGWTVVTLTGNDRQTFLHNMCTNEIKKLGPGQGCEAFCTDVKGKIVAHVFVLLTDDKTYLIAVPNQAEKLISHLDRYIIREEVELEDYTTSHCVTLVAGHNAERLLGKALGDKVGFPFEPWQNQTSDNLLSVRFPLPGSTTFLAISENSFAKTWHEKLIDAGAIACDLAAWNSYRIEAGLPCYGVDFSGEHLPQEVARNEEAINFNKGCYLGQETIARLDALGHVNKQLVTLKFPSDSQPEPGTTLSHEEKQVGAATSIAWSPVLGAPIGIAMIRRGANGAGTKLNSDVGLVEVVATPIAG